MTDYINKDVPVANGITTPFGGYLYPWMSIKSGFESQFAEIRMRGAIYDKNGIELTPGGGPGGVEELSDVGNVNDSAKTNGSILIYNTATQEWESKANILIDDVASIVSVNNDKIMFQRKDSVAGDFTALLKAWGVNTNALVRLENSNGADLTLSCESNGATIKFDSSLGQLIFAVDNVPLIKLFADGRLTSVVPGYTPTFDGDYATKKYVDTIISPIINQIFGGYECNAPFSNIPETYVIELPLSGIITPNLSAIPLLVKPLSNFTCAPSGVLTYTGSVQAVVQIDVALTFSWKKVGLTSLVVQNFYLSTAVNNINQSGAYASASSDPNNVTSIYVVYSCALSTVLTLNPGDTVTMRWENGLYRFSTPTFVRIQSLSFNIANYK